MLQNNTYIYNLQQFYREGLTTTGSETPTNFIHVHTNYVHSTQQTID